MTNVAQPPTISADFLPPETPPGAHRLGGFLTPENTPADLRCVTCYPQLPRERRRIAHRHGRVAEHAPRRHEDG